MHYPIGLFRFQTFFYILFPRDEIMRRIVRTLKRTLRLVDGISKWEVSEFVKPEIIKELNKTQISELESEETYFTTVTPQQFDRCVKICNGSMVN